MCMDIFDVPPAPVLAAQPNHALRQQSCEVCLSREGLIRCEYCQVTYYCSTEHKESDLDRHMEKCRHMKDEFYSHPSTEEDPWTYLFGMDDSDSDMDDSDMEDTEMLQKVYLTLHLFPNIAAVESSLDIMLGMYNDERPFRWPAISKAISDLIPVLYVRLHQDKQAYKFICRHTSDRIFRQQEYYYESANVGVGHHATTEKRHANQTPLNLEQVYEAATLGHKVLLTLMGIKVLQYLKDIEHASIFLKGEFTNFPQEMIDLICEGMGAGSSTEPFGFSFIKATGEPAWRREKISEMQQLITKFVRGVMRRNGYMWTSMLNVERWLTPRRFAEYLYDTCIRWDEDSTAKLLAIRQYQVWMETPGSFAVLRQAMDAAGLK